MRKVTLAGIKFYKVDDEIYRQVDGPWSIEAHPIPYECDDKHPVRLSYKTAEIILAQKHLWSFEAVNGARAFLCGRAKGYQCPGMEEHYEMQWIAHNDDVDNFDHLGLWQDTPTNVAELIRDDYYKLDTPPSL